MLAGFFFSISQTFGRNKEALWDERNGSVHRAA